MGRIFAAIIDDTFGWHDTVCGNTHAEHVTEKWGKRDYQNARNKWYQNGNDAFLVELGKYKLKRQDMAANINFFSAVHADDNSELTLQKQSVAGDSVTLRFEMDTLVMLHTCPHPLNQSAEYPVGDVQFELSKAAEIQPDDPALNLCPENQRGYQNNALYHLGL
jgi:urea carboxylase-associated protein 2